MLMLRVRFKGEEYVLIRAGEAMEGPLATQDQYIHGRRSYAHVFPSGIIQQMTPNGPEMIGHVRELEILGDVDLGPAADAWDNLLSGWK